MAEYIWLMGGTGQLRSKTKVLDAKPSCAEEAPIMIVESNPDGQLAEPNHELFLKPRKIFRDPFRGGDHILVLCDTFIVAQVRAVAAQLCNPGSLRGSGLVAKQLANCGLGGDRGQGQGSFSGCQPGVRFRGTGKRGVT